MALTNKLSAIGNAIREKTGKTDLLTLEQMSEEIKGIETRGEPDAELVRKAELLYISNQISFQGITDLTEIELDCANKTSAQYMFNGCTNLVSVKLKNTGKIKTWYQCFAVVNSLKLVSVEELDLSSTTNTQFNFPLSVTRLKLVPNTLKITTNFSKLKNLDAESIQSIVNSPTDLTGQTTQTLTLHADVKAKLTETQIASITSKNWTLA